MKKVREKLSFIDDKAQRRRNLYNFVTVSLMISNSLLSNKTNTKKELLITNTSKFHNTILIALKSCLFFISLKLHRINEYMKEKKG